MRKKSDDDPIFGKYNDLCRSKMFFFLWGGKRCYLFFQDSISRVKQLEIGHLRVFRIKNDANFQKINFKKSQNSEKFTSNRGFL